MNETFNLTILRDSVSAGDDSNAPHANSIKIGPSSDLAQVLAEVRRMKFLPQVDGDHATWIVEIGESAVAVIAQQYPEPHFILDKETKFQNLLNSPNDPLFFRYWCQIDPNLVVECLITGKPLPNKYGVSHPL